MAVVCSGVTADAAHDFERCWVGVYRSSADILTRDPNSFATAAVTQPTPYSESHLQHTHLTGSGTLLRVYSGCNGQSNRSGLTASRVQSQSK
jgi:hypothetical protein